MATIETESLKNLRSANWQTVCYVVQPDKNQLKESIRTYGILSPIVVNKNNVVIDGYARIDIAASLGIVNVPVVRVDVDEVEEMLLHINLNRYRGIVVAKFMSQIIKRILSSRKYTYEDLRKKMRLTSEEFDVLSSGSLIKMRKIKQHTYSPAWVPIESKTGDDIQIERPTGHSEQV